MKRFKYSLETVLDYKNQVLDNLKQEHAEITRSVNEKREEIHHLERTMDDYQAEFDETKKRRSSNRKLSALQYLY